MADTDNATQAALAAGYSEGGAAKAGYRLSKDDQVLSMLRDRTAEVHAKLEITTERILLERARLAFFDPRKLFDRQGNPIPIHDDDDTAREGST